MICILFLTSNCFVYILIQPEILVQNNFQVHQSSKIVSDLHHVSLNYYLCYFISTLALTLTSMLFVPLASIQKKIKENSFRKLPDKRQRKRTSAVLKDITNIDFSLATENQKSPTSTVFPDTEFGGLLS